MAKFAVTASWIANWFLLAAKLYLFIATLSRSVLAALADSVVDPPFILTSICSGIDSFNCFCLLWPEPQTDHPLVGSLPRRVSGVELGRGMIPLGIRFPWGSSVK